MWISQGFLVGNLVWFDTIKFMLQLQMMLFVDYTMTNTKNFDLAIISG
jgi:hypothetical protein